MLLPVAMHICSMDASIAYAVHNHQCHTYILMWITVFGLPQMQAHLHLTPLQKTRLDLHETLRHQVDACIQKGKHSTLNSTLMCHHHNTLGF